MKDQRQLFDQVHQSYLIPRYVALCERPELLTVEEGIRLGMETVISLSRARECARNQATRGGRCLSPATLGGTELTEIIKDHFNTMIASAQVFSPRQPPDPRENLRVLQSPLRAPFPRPPSAPGSPSPSLAKPRAASASSDSDDNEAETTTFVQGAHPRVVEEARDLVILENVELAAPAPTQDRGCQGGSVVPPPKTPRRQSLHRAVLIRSAQHAVWAANAAATPSSTSNSSSSASSTPTPGPVIRGRSTAPAHASAPSLGHSRVVAVKVQQAVGFLYGNRGAGERLSIGRKVITPDDPVKNGFTCSEICHAFGPSDPRDFRQDSGQKSGRSLVPGLMHNR
ncbi:hypothetical protein B0H11DRAFT_2208921 [Mycena galericulata]|nr:hypothetical protein B0H11DRAFT_2208921 [Mycena galericulata]